MSTRRKCVFTITSHLQHGHEQHLLEKLKELSAEAEHQKGEEFGAKMRRFEEELEGLLNTVGACL